MLKFLTLFLKRFLLERVENGRDVKYTNKLYAFLGINKIIKDRIRILHSINGKYSEETI